MVKKFVRSGLVVAYPFVKRIPIFIIAAFHWFAQAQAPADWELMKKRYSGEQAVFLNHQRFLTLSVKNDTLKADEEVSEELLILKDVADFLSTREISGSYFQEVSDLKAKVLTPENGKYREQQVTSIVRKSDRDNAIFFDDSYKLSFSFPYVAPRSKTFVSYKQHYRDVRFLPAFFFGRYLPCEKIELTIRAPKNTDLQFFILNDSAKRIVHHTFEKGPFVYHKWEAQQIPALPRGPSAPSTFFTTPQVIVYIKSFVSAGNQKPVLRNLDDLYQWYGSFVKNLGVDSLQGIKKVVDQLVSPADSELEKVRKMYYWVQNNIKYIAFEDGMRGFIPHQASYVFTKRYGDCKDMASLLVGMLRTAGIKSYYTWIGTRDLPYRYSQIPTPLVDNHMIATYVSPSGEYYFLDGTSQHTRFGLPSSMIQGKEALVGISRDSFRIVNVPVQPAHVSSMTDSVAMNVKSGHLQGKGKVSLEGYAKVFGGYELDRSQKDAEKQYVTKLVGKGSNKFFLDDYQIKELQNQDKPTRINYEFRLNDYAKSIGDEIFVNMNLNKLYFVRYTKVVKLFL
jgi:transglutaminase-like putative cysteine protease